VIAVTRDELLEKLNSVEWDDIEFKEASWAVPKSSLETVSAFANTKGGHLVFGVSEGDGILKITGVTDVEKVQNDFLGQTRDIQKISVILKISGHVHKLSEGAVICFHIPEASRVEKPVYLDQNPKKAFVRRGGGDYRCTGDELMRFIRDAGSSPFDSEPLALDPTTFFDEATLRWYRARFEASNPGKDGAVDDSTFLRNWGLLVEKDGQLRPTRAAVLVLGTAPLVRQQLPRMVVDLQLYRHAADEYASATRWADRVSVEANLVEAWKIVLDFYQKHSDRPFSVDPATLRRHDDPPDYISFREAAINLLIHQDFGDLTRVPAIRFFTDRTVFFNPGDAFASREQLLDPGDKEVRNPRIVGAFRRIGLSDQGGTGVGAIFDSWRKLGYLPPEIDNNKADKTFRLTMRKEKLITEAQLLTQASLGATLSEHEAAVFAYLTHRPQISLTDVKALTGLNGVAAKAVLDRLVAQVLIEPIEPGGTHFGLPGHLRARYGGAAAGKSSPTAPGEGTTTAGSTTEQATEQAGGKSTEHVRHLVRLTEGQRRVIEHADVPRTLADLMERTGYKQRPHFMAQLLKPLLEARLLRMTVPDKPRSPMQQYVLTEAGIKLRELRAQERTSPRTDESDHE
jgi:ATP-dependent DNA helicase RecG